MFECNHFVIVWITEFEQKLNIELKLFLHYLIQNKCVETNYWNVSGNKVKNINVKFIINRRNTHFELFNIIWNKCVETNWWIDNGYRGKF